MWGRRRQEMHKRIAGRIASEGAAIRAQFKDKLLKRRAELSSRGLGASGPAFEATHRNHIAALRIEALMYFKVEISGHRSERLPWTRAERGEFAKRYEQFFKTRATSITSEQQIAWQRNRLTFPADQATRIEREALNLHARLAPEADEAIATAQSAIRRELRQQRMFYVAFWSAIATGAGEVVRSLPKVEELFGHRSAATAPLPTPTIDPTARSSPTTTIPQPTPS